MRAFPALSFLMDSFHQRRKGFPTMRVSNQAQSLRDLVLGVIAVSVAILALCLPIAGMPSLSQILSPTSGLWSNQVDRQDFRSQLKDALARSSSIQRSSSKTELIDRQSESVRLEIDTNFVATLSSPSEYNLYFAQGYWVATHRLWQMEFLSRLASGRVSEILGPRGLPIDRFMRKLELQRAAAKSHELMSQDPETRVAIDAFSAGVNARIEDVGEGRVPLPTEFFLLGLRPQKWEPVNSALMQKFMSWYLSGRLDDLRFEKSLQKLGPTGVMDLFPLEVPDGGTILGRDPRTRIAKFAKPAPSMPNVSSSEATQHVSRLSQFANGISKLGVSSDQFVLEADPSTGSNNWVVPASRSRTSSPILSNDLHLSYTIPALWIPMRLHLTEGPTAHRVFGAALVGAPGIIVGHNDDLAWAVTNGTDDVLDFYRLRFRDEKRTEYIFDDEWRPLISREEKILVRGKQPEVLLLRETHLGPLWIDNQIEGSIAQIPEGVVMKWVGHEASNELKTFLRLNRGKGVLACPDAFEFYVSPAQNFICVDRDGRVGYWKAGLFPKRPAERPLEDHPVRGVHEVSSSEEVWRGWIDRRENPSRYPVTDYFSTANQAPFPGRSVSDFGWHYAPPFRNLRIQEVLRGKQDWSPEEIVRMQADDQHWLGHRQKKLILKYAREFCASDLVTELESWVGRYSPESKAATLHNAWWNEIQESVWATRIGNQREALWPEPWRFLQLIEVEPDSPWWDDPTTAEVENFDARARRSMKAVCPSKNSSDSVTTWNEQRPTRIQHVSRLPGLGVRVNSAPGADDTIFANRGDHGPSWKMVVTFVESQPKVWFAFPGGVSGDPSSSLYDQYVSTWAKGDLLPVEEVNRYAR